MERPQENANQENVLIAACLFVLATIALAASFHFTRPVMIPFVLAIFLSYFVSPVINFSQDRLRLPRPLAVLLSLAFFVVISTALFFILKGSLLKIIESFSLYEERLRGFLLQVSSMAAYFNIRFDEQLAMDALKQLPVFSFVQSAASSFLTFFLNFFLVLVFVIFLVSGPRAPKRRAGLLGEIDDRIRKYIVTKVITSLLTAIGVGIILYLLKLDLALMFGVLTFFLSFIPTLGSIIATLLPLPIALIQFNNAFDLGMILLIPGAYQLIIGNLLEPKMIGKSLDLHPVTILLALMFWGLI
jgi:AI-2 transport protein TqsA